jgi:putative phosphoribosyl transferase
MPTFAIQRGVCVETAGARLSGDLYLPPRPRGFVLFASNRDLMRLDRRQVDLGEALNERGIGTLLFDLVETTDDAETESNLEILTERLIGATEWSLEQWGVDGLPLGYVGSSLGSAAALVAAVALEPKICAIASHGGRPDLAADGLAKVQAPTLLLIVSDDVVAAEAAVSAAHHLRSPHQIRSANSHRPGSGSWEAAPLICEWMEWHLSRPEGG